MGIINKGILGPVSGTVGTVIGGSWKGIAYIRSQSTSRRTEFTQPQLEQQRKFATTIAFLQPMVAFLSFTFREFAVKKSGFNSAFSYNLKNAVAGSYPDYEIDYSMALVSRGDLPNVTTVTASIPTTTSVHYTWTDNSGAGKAAPTDKSLLVVYCPSRNQCLFSTSGGDRNAGTATIDVTPFQGQVVETYIGFVSENGKDVANSIFTGEFTLV